MNRRGFFKAALRRTGRKAVEAADRKATRKAARWIRPPFALAELDFLMTCTRCGDCISACPHGVVFPLPVRCGAQALGTPALDLGNRGCHLCPEWPCVTACRSGALRLPEPGAGTEAAGEPGRPPRPRLATATIDPTVCLPYAGPECGACSASCPVPDAMQWLGPRPRIDPRRCLGCALCRQACIVEPKAVRIRSLHSE